MTKYTWIPKNKGKRLYKCTDCGTGTFLKIYMFNTRYGDRCMNCGGRLEAKSENAVQEQKAIRTAYNRLQESKPSHICFTRPRNSIWPASPSA